MPGKSEFKGVQGGVETRRTRVFWHLGKVAPVDIEFNDLTYAVPNGREGSKPVLRGISGRFKSGEMSVILGPSGAGKSTLLNILAGYKLTGTITGHVTVNSQPRNPGYLRKMSSYIMQDDLLQPWLTVNEAMRFAADLKLANASPEAKLIAIDEILSTLRLTQARDTTTECLSGGERKRLSIALELVNNPPVIVLDEPTSGLDELSASQCIDLLKSLAKTGRTVICSLHTPSAKIFSKFDHVYVLSGGQCVYRSTVDNLVNFFQRIGIECPKHYNPADFAIEVSAGEYNVEWVSRMIKSVNAEYPIVRTFPTKEIESEGDHPLEKQTSKVPWVDQFTVLLRRMLLQLRRNKNYLYLKMGLHVFLGLMVGGLFLQAGNDATKALYNFGFCLACLVVLLFVPMLPILMHFPSEVRLIKREHFNMWYDLSSYYCALTVVNIPVQILLTAIYLSLVYTLTDQPLEFARCAMFCTTCILCSFIAESMGFAIGSTLNIVNSTFVGPAISVPLMLVAVQGIGESQPVSIYRKLLMYTSYLRYALEALSVALYDHKREMLYCPPSEIYCEFRAPRQILIFTRTDSAVFWVDIAALTVILLLLKGVSYYLLRQRIMPNKTFQTIYLIGKLARNYFNTSY